MSSKLRPQDHHQIASINKPIDPADAITSVVTTFKQRDQWSRKTARDPRVKLMHRHVLRSLALCARTDSGGTLVIDPTYAELAKAARCDRSTAIRAVNVAEQISIVRRARHSDGRVSNAYELLLPQAGSNGDKFAVPTVTNSDADEGPNGGKFPVPTVANWTDAEGSNGRTAATVLRLRERKEVSKKESESAERDLTTLNDRPIPEPRAREPLAPEPREPLTPVQRAVPALTETVAAQKQPAPSFASKIDMGRPAANGRAAPETNVWQAGFERVKAEWPPDRISDDAKAFFAFCSALNALGDIDDVVDAIITMRLERDAGLPDLADALVAIIERNRAITTTQEDDHD